MFADADKEPEIVTHDPEVVYTGSCPEVPNPHTTAPEIDPPDMAIPTTFPDTEVTTVCPEIATTEPEATVTAPDIFAMVVYSIPSRHCPMIYTFYCRFK
jgi:hypothetical protein